MDLHPFHWLSGFPARANRLEFRILFLHLGVTRHASLGVREVRVRGHVHEAVAITAIHPELRDAQIVRKRHRLDRFIADAGVFRSHVIPGRRGQAGTSAPPQIATFSGNQFDQRGKKFAIKPSEPPFPGSRQSPSRKRKSMANRSASLRRLKSEG